MLGRSKRATEVDLRLNRRRRVRGKLDLSSLYHQVLHLMLGFYTLVLSDVVHLFTFRNPGATIHALCMLNSAFLSAAYCSPGSTFKFKFAHLLRKSRFMLQVHVGFEIGQNSRISEALSRSFPMEPFRIPLSSTPTPWQLRLDIRGWRNTIIVTGTARMRSSYMWILCLATLH